MLAWTLRALDISVIELSIGVTNFYGDTAVTKSVQCPPKAMSYCVRFLDTDGGERCFCFSSGGFIFLRRNVCEGLRRLRLSCVIDW